MKVIRKMTRSPESARKHLATRAKFCADVKAAIDLLREGKTRVEASMTVGRGRHWLSAVYARSMRGNYTWVWKSIDEAEGREQ